MVISRTPLRVSFVGGGSDLPAFAETHGGAVLSTTIDKFVYVLVTERFEEEIRVSYSQTEIVENVKDLKHELVREALKTAGLPRRVEIVTIADVPSRGSGLGSSSAVTVGTLNALFAYQGILKSASDLAYEASRIEIDVLGKPIGKQDQYACAFGGLQLLRFGPGEKVRRDPVVVPAPELRKLEQSLLMFYTGHQRSATKILREVETNIGEDALIGASLERMRNLALKLARELGNGKDPEILGRFLDENWELKRTLTSKVSNSRIDRWYRRAKKEGALGGKLLGAGGGGFLLFYVPRERQDAVRRALSELRELPIRFESEGSRIMHIAR